MRLDFRPDPAPTLSNLTAESVYGGIQLRWTVPVDDTFFATEIWASQTNDRSTATEIDTVIGTTYYFIANPGVQWYFWIRSSNKFGRTDGTWFPTSSVPSSSGDTGWVTHGSTKMSNYGSAADIVNIANVTAEDGVFATSTTTGYGSEDIALYNYNLASVIDANATIKAIQVRVKAKVSTTAANPYYGLRLNWDGAAFTGYDSLESLTFWYNYLTTTNTTVDSPATTTSLAADWGQYNNFATDQSRTITTADIRSTNFGVSLYITANGGSLTFSFDYVAVKVFWELGGGVAGTAGSGTTGSLTTNGDLTTTGDISTTGNIATTGTVSAVGDISTSGQLLGTYIGSTGDLECNGNVIVGTKVQLPYTNESAGSTGNKTINKISGRVRVAAAGTSVTVTNSQVTSASHIIATCSTNDTTAYVKNVVPGSGTFTINLGAAATAETAIDWVVLN